MTGRLIRVTADDIAQGKPGVCAQCPIALAARRVFGRTAEVGDVIYLDNATQWSMSASAHDFIEAFDGGYKVKPFAFVARIAK